jgi:hypothetical protein
VSSIRQKTARRLSVCLPARDSTLCTAGRFEFWWTKLLDDLRSDIKVKLQYKYVDIDSIASQRLVVNQLLGGLTCTM